MILSSVVYIQETRVCVKLDDTHTSFFNANTGVRQGYVLSPNLFKLYINNLPIYFQTLP